MSLPYFPFYPKDYEAKTAHLTLAEDGAYMRLLRLAWMTPGCSLPDDDAWIKRRMRVSDAEFASVVKVVLDEFFVRKSGRLISQKLTDEYQKTDVAHAKRVLAGSMGGKAKAANLKDKQSSNAVAMLKQPEPEPYKKERDTNVSLKKPDMTFSILCHEATEQAVTSFMAYRKRKKLDMTETGAKRLAKHLRAIFDAGGDTDDALAMAEERGWRTVEPGWYFRERAGNGNGTHTNGTGRPGVHDGLLQAASAVARGERSRFE